MDTRQALELRSTKAPKFLEDTKWQIKRVTTRRGLDTKHNELYLNGKSPRGKALVLAAKYQLKPVESAVFCFVHVTAVVSYCPTFLAVKE